MEKISFDQFLSVNMRVGAIREVRGFPEARKPAYQLFIDFGQEIGMKKSSAQICANYEPEDLTGRRVIAVVNFPPKQIANFMSEVLVLGVRDEKGDIVLLEVSDTAEIGERVH